ncbi:MAG: BamA/TamA family outer membrane protein [Saprospiraceae bacterium]
MYNPAGLRYGLLVSPIQILIWLVVIYAGIAVGISQTDHINLSNQEKPDSNTFLIANVKDTHELKLKIEHWIFKQLQDGHWLASQDSVFLNPPIHAKLYKGSQYKMALTELDSFESIVGNFSNKRFFQMQPADLVNLMNAWVRNKANLGYPFCKIELQGVRVLNDTLHYQINKILGPRIQFRQTEQRNKKPLRDFVLNRLTRIFPASIYNQELVENIPFVFKNIPAVHLSSEPRVLFLGDEGIVWLYLDKNKLNRFDFILGFSPETGLSSRKFRLTGEGGFELHNAFRMTERIFMKYENLNDQSPRLNLGFEFPYLNYLPIGVSQLINLYKYREEYFDLYNQSGISYPIAFNQGIKATFNYRSSSLLNPDTLRLLSTKRLPEQLDYRYLSGGFSYHWTSLDNINLPIKGFQFRVNLQYGKKKIKESSILLAYNSDALNVKQQYDSLNINQDQALIQLNLDYYLKLSRRHTFKLSTNLQSILASGSLVSNELFRIGGFKDLRGFDEDFFKSSDDLIQTLEYRFFLDRASFINLFVDMAYLNQSIGTAFEWTYNMGFGTGIQFQTKIGNFSLQYALGQSKDQTLSFSNGKIHFGYTNFF